MWQTKTFSQSKGQRCHQGHAMMLPLYPPPPNNALTKYQFPPTPNQCPYQISTSYTLQFLRYSLNKMLKVKITTAEPQIKSRSHNVTHQHPHHVPTKHYPLTSYSFQDKAIVITARSNQGHTMMLHTYTPLMSL